MFYYKTIKDYFNRKRNKQIFTGEAAKSNFNYLSKIKLMLLFKYNFQCCYCKETLILDDTLEHYRPKYSYPWLKYEVSNILIACEECNAKNKKTRFKTINPKITFSNTRVIPEFFDVVKLNSQERPLIINPNIVDFEYFISFNLFRKTYFENFQSCKFSNYMKSVLYGNHDRECDNRTFFLKDILKKSSNIEDLLFQLIDYILLYSRHFNFFLHVLKNTEQYLELSEAITLQKKEIVLSKNNLKLLIQSLIEKLTNLDSEIICLQINKEPILPYVIPSKVYNNNIVNLINSSN